MNMKNLNAKTKAEIIRLYTDCFENWTADREANVDLTGQVGQSLTTIRELNDQLTTVGGRNYKLEAVQKEIQADISTARRELSAARLAHDEMTTKHLSTVNKRDAEISSLIAQLSASEASVHIVRKSTMWLTMGIGSMCFGVGMLAGLMF